MKDEEGKTIQEGDFIEVSAKENDEEKTDWLVEYTEDRNRKESVSAFNWLANYTTSTAMEDEAEITCVRVKDKERGELNVNEKLYIVNDRKEEVNENFICRDRLSVKIVKDVNPEPGLQFFTDEMNENNSLLKLYTEERAEKKFYKAEEQRKEWQDLHMFLACVYENRGSLTAKDAEELEGITRDLHEYFQYLSVVRNAQEWGTRARKGKENIQRNFNLI